MKIFTESLTGKRSSNEDCHIKIINSNHTDKTKHPVDVFAIFDGHGGDAISRYLARNMPKLLMDMNLITFPYKKSSINNAHSKLQDDITKKKIGIHCGSTSLVVVRYIKNKKNYINVFNVGDSRCILCRNNIAIPLTLDHKPDFPEERERIKALGGVVYYDGSDHRICDLSVSRAFGDNDAKPYVIAVPSIDSYRIEENDKFIVLGCDGLYDCLTNQDIVNFILEFTDLKTGAFKSKKNIASELANYAIKKGSMDNISIIIVFF